MGSVRLDPGQLTGLKLISEDPEEVRLRTLRGLKLTVTCDSVLRLDSRRALPVTVTGAFIPQFLRSERPGLLALDPVGGFGVYYLPQLQKRVDLAATAGGFSFTQSFPPETTVLVSICPPREYNWKQHAEERIVHQFPQLMPGVFVTDGNSPRGLPTDDELREWRKIANVLVLHLEFWDGFGVRHIKPKDPVRFQQVLDLAHELGYLVLPYSSPYYYQPAYANGLRPDATDLYLEEARWLLETYDIDGLYWDGEFEDVLQAWDCIRRTRKLLGDKRLYVHCTTLPLPYSELYCPFVNTWADYLLRGEGYFRPRVDQLYLRYVVSGYNISNAIGELCYDGARVDEAMVDWALQANARFPYWPGLQVHGGRKYFLSPEEDRVYRERYLPAAQQVTSAADYAPLAAAGRQEWQARQDELEAAAAAGRTALAQYVREQREKFAAQEQGNLAAFTTPLCSDYTTRREGLHGIGFVPEYATDHNPDTYWGIDFLPQWLTIDLGEPQTIRRVWLQTYFGDERYYHYRIEVSEDNQNWRQVAEKTDNALSTERGFTYEFEPALARYVRITVTHNSANNAGHIVEVGVYEQ